MYITFYNLESAEWLESEVRADEVPVKIVCCDGEYNPYEFRDYIYCENSVYTGKAM